MAMLKASASSAATSEVILLSRVSQSGKILSAVNRIIREASGLS